MELAALFLRNWGAGSLLALCVLLIIFGKLVPRATVDDVMKDRDMWREMALKALSQAELIATLSPVIQTTADTTKHIEQMTCEIQSTTIHMHH